MSNLRIVYDNAADRATLTASTEAGSLVASNLLTEFKSEVWRSVGTSATLTLTWTATHIESMVAMPFTNLSGTSTIRVRGYAEAADTTPLFDTGEQAAVPYPSLGLWDWGTPLGANSFAYGGAKCAVIWFTPTNVKKLVIDLADADNTSGYIESSRIVTGHYWSPENNCDYGVQVSMEDSSKHERTDAGDLRTDRGHRYKTLKCNVSNMPAMDRADMWDMIQYNGLTRPIFLSVRPGAEDTEEERMFQIYGKMSRMSAISYEFVNRFNTSLDLEEV